MSVHFRVCHHPSKAEARATDVVVHDSGTSEDPWTGTWHRRGKGSVDHRSGRRDWSPRVAAASLFEEDAVLAQQIQLFPRRGLFHLPWAHD